MSENALVAQDDALAILAAAGVQLETPKEDAPRISIKGKVFRFFREGEWHTVTKEEDGEIVNASMLNAVILGHAPTRAYALFEGGFKEGENSAPVCFSHDSKKPDAAVQEPKSASCESCEKRVVGSAFSEGGQATRACRESRLISVVIDADKTSTPLQLRLAVGSLWQSKENAGENESKGWFAYDAYTTMLAKKGIAHPCMVQTKIKFGSSAGVTMLFKMDGHLPKEHLLAVAKLAGSEEVKKTLGLIQRTPQQAVTTAPAIESKPSPVSVAPAEVAPEKVAEPVKAAEPKVEKPKEVKKAAPKAEPAPAVEVADVDIGDQLSDW